MLESIVNIGLSAWISGAGSLASIVALSLALWEWRRVKTVRQELEEQRNHFAKLHFLADDLRQLREHRTKLRNHRSHKRWDQVGEHMRGCLGNLEAMTPRLDEAASESHKRLVAGIGDVLPQLPTGDDAALTTAVSQVIGHLARFITVVDNVLREYQWRQKP